MPEHSPEIKSGGSKARVLIVDDMLVNRTILSSMLSTLGIDCDLAESGRECLDLCARNSYDLILLDHRMPDMDGVDTLVQLKELFRRSGTETPVICHTADDGRNYLNLYKAAGFADVLIKPADPGQLTLLLMTYLPDGGYKLPVDEEKQRYFDDELNALPGWLKAVPKLDLASGIEHCNCAADYLDALAIFTGSIKDKADDIERFEREENWPMYVLRVHSLKSVARLVGAVSIADSAADLEYAGRNGEYKLVHAGTAALLKEYRSMLPRLEKLLSKAESPLRHINKKADEAGRYEEITEVREAAPADFRTILFVGDENTIVSKGIIKSLTDDGFKIITEKDIPEFILRHRRESNLILYYPSGDTDHIKVVSSMLAEMCRDDNKTLCLTGDPVDIDAALKIHDKDSISSVYPRPVDLNRMVTDLLEYADMQAEYKRTKNILVIDDDADFLTIIEYWLSEVYNVHCSRSGADALSYLESHRPDLILLDYEMPGMNGNKVMDRIRSNPRNEHIPIIFLTGKNDRECVIKILEKKPDGYLLKSMPREVLLDSLDRFFAGSIKVTCTSDL